MSDILYSPDKGCYVCSSKDTLVLLPGQDPRFLFRVCLDCSSRYARDLPVKQPNHRGRTGVGANNILGGPLGAVQAARAATTRTRIALCLPPDIPCPDCEGSGGPDCTPCEGKGGWEKTHLCGLCESRGSYPCPACKATGKQLFFLTCEQCKGQAKLECEVCRGTGIAKERDPCRDCEGSGHTCKRCRGTGRWQLYRRP